MEKISKFAGLFMKQLIGLILGLFVLTTGIFSQTLEIGLMGGASYYLGDLNPGKHFKQMKPAGGIYARINVDDYWSYRFALMNGRLASDDNNPNRALNFKSPITDFSLVAEFNFWPYFTGSMKSYFTPYIFGGVAVFAFQPTTSDGVKLSGMGTEGQMDVKFMDSLHVHDPNRKYRTVGIISIPFGIGFKYSLTKKIGIAAEWGMRKTFTDYIDDVSTTYFIDSGSFDPSKASPEEIQQFELSDPTGTHIAFEERGDPGTKDWYNFFGISITYKFNLNKNSTCVDFRDN